MLKKLRKRFVLLAFLSLAVALTAALAIGNALNYVSTRKELDSLIGVIYENGSVLPKPADLPDGVTLGAWYSKETPFRTRFFSVSYAADGTLSEVNLDNVAVDDFNEVQGYVDSVKPGRTSGFSGDYRYCVFTDGDGGRTLVFLYCRGELDSLRMFLLVSLAAALFVLGLSLVLILPLSKRIVKSSAEGVEKQKRFITDAGHELKTPLTIITTSADVLASEQGENEWVQNIRRQSERLARLAEDLLTLAKLDEKAPRPAPIRFSLSEAAWDTAAPFAHLAKTAGKSFCQEIGENIDILGDEASVQQVMSILLDNAVKYALPGGEISFTVSRQKKNAVIQVCNPCEPVTREQLSRFFDRFYRVDPSRSRETGGNGIGLAIAKSMTEAQGGRICVHSDDGRSVRFTVTFPARPLKEA